MHAMQALGQAQAAAAHRLALEVPAAALWQQVLLQLLLAAGTSRTLCCFNIPQLLPRLLLRGLRQVALIPVQHICSQDRKV